MLSFKQYLRESLDEDEGDVMIILYFTKESVNQLDIDHLQTQLPDIVEGAESMSYSWVRLFARKDVTDDYLQEQFAIIKKHLPDAELKNQGYSARIVLHGFPANYTVDCPRNTVIIDDKYSSKVTSLKDVHKFIKGAGIISFSKPENIKSNVLGLLKVKGLMLIQNAAALSINLEWSKIINKHLASGRNIMDCQEELMDAGLEEYAQL